MRFLSADLLLTPQGQLQDKLVLILDDDGTILDLQHDSAVAVSVERHKGILIPGLINAHCHLELSHMQGVIPTGGGLHEFLNQIIQTRKATPATEQDAAFRYDEVMWENGIQAVGDICNNEVTWPAKVASKIRYHNFIETFGLDTAKAEGRFAMAAQLHASSKASGMSASIVPHATYSVSDPLYAAIQNAFNPATDIWSIHFLESKSEKELIQDGTGPMKAMYASLGIIPKEFEGHGTTVAEWVLQHIPQAGKILFVHNTYLQLDDIAVLKASGRFNDMYFCLCPKANLYIEGRLPNVPMMIQAGCKIVLGTDSLASNNGLSLVDEIITLQQHYPELDAAQLYQCATAHGAELFGWNDLGGFEKGKKPGVVLVDGVSSKRLA
jgi:cytosine/adenosine deaminase-related metal-dependent hydrolase